MNKARNCIMGVLAGSFVAMGSASSSYGSLVAYYSFNNSAALGNDDSGNGKTLTAVGTPAISSTTGSNGTNAALFQAITGTPSATNPNDAFHYTGTSNFYPDTPNFSLSLTATPSGATAAGNIVRTSTLNLVDNSNNTYSAIFGSSTSLTSTSIPHAAGTATHLVVTFQDPGGVIGAASYLGTATLYIDGVQASTATVTYTPGTSTELFALGDRNTTTNTTPFLGSLDDVAFYDQTLTAAQAVGLSSGTLTPLTVVPEPASLALIGMSGLTLLRKRSR